MVTYVIFDFESMLIEGGMHRPNLCVCHTACHTCLSIPMEGNEGDCPCGRARHVFKGDNTVVNFGDWLFCIGRKNTICIAHNSKGYDLHFSRDYLHAHAIKPTLIQNGRKIMCLTAGSIKCIDSLQFLPMGLARLPEAFGLKELSKGFFPHLFNIP